MANNNGKSPLWRAAANGSTQSVRVLLSAKEKGLDLNQKPTGGDDQGKTPLKIARERNKADVVALLEEAGEDDGEGKPGVAPPEEICKELFWAACNGKVAKVSFDYL